METKPSNSLFIHARIKNNKLCFQQMHTPTAEYTYL